MADDPLRCLMLEVQEVKDEFVGVTMDPNRERIDGGESGGKASYDQEFFTFQMYEHKFLPRVNEYFELTAPGLLSPPSIVKLLQSRMFYDESVVAGRDDCEDGAPSRETHDAYYELAEDSTMPEVTRALVDAQKLLDQLTGDHLMNKAVQKELDALLP